MLKSIVILVDTREKEGKNDHILKYFDGMKIEWKRRKLDAGDYSFYLKKNEELGIPHDIWFDKEIMVERKANLEEFAANISRERDRIKKELTIAPPNKVILIENASYSDMVNGNYQSNYSPKSYFATVHSFWHEFNVPFVFMDDKRFSGLFIIGYFQYYLHNIIK